MSLKPPKKSDLDKKWMKKRLDRAIKIQPEYHLIVTEGTDTEPEYFGSIKEVINKKYPEKIKLQKQKYTMKSWGNLSLICSWIFLCVSGGRKIFILRWQDKKHTSIQSHYRISI